MFAAVVVALGQTVMMVISSGLYGAYPTRLPGLALGVILSTFVLARLGQFWRKRPLSSSARFVLACASAVLFLKLAGLLHPAKPIIDAMFHAHRLDRVLAGEYWFSQTFGNGLQMPYAIGLYVFAAPWAWVTADHMALVRTVTAASDVVVGALLYPVLLFAWGDRRAAALAAVLYQLVPLPFATLGDANLTNMFGQSMALATMAAATTWRLAPTSADARRFRVGDDVGVCSHVGTVTILRPRSACSSRVLWRVTPTAGALRSLSSSRRLPRWCCHGSCSTSTSRKSSATRSPGSSCRQAPRRPRQTPRN
jgi:hypothetical protein